MSGDKNTLQCSFCGKSQHEARILVAGPSAFICDECVEVCLGIVFEYARKAKVEPIAHTAAAPAVVLE